MMIIRILVFPGSQVFLPWITKEGPPRTKKYFVTGIAPHPQKTKFGFKTKLCYNNSVKNKQYHFLVALPRSGNTLLGSLINQNLNVCLTQNSILIEMLWQLRMIRSNDLRFANFPDIKSFENVAKNVFKNYYANHKANIIIDRGLWGAPDNIDVIKNYVTKKPKFVILYRPVVECLASFVKAGDPLRDEALLNHYLPHNGFLGNACMAIKNILVQKEDYIFVTYKELTEQPEHTVKRIFDFIEEDYIPINTTDLKQMNINNIVYNDSVLEMEHHKIITDSIRNENIKVEDYLSEMVIKAALEHDNILEYLE